MNSKDKNEDLNLNDPQKRSSRIFSTGKIIFVFSIIFFVSGYIYATKYSKWSIRRNLININNFNYIELFWDSMSIGAYISDNIPDKSYAGKLHLYDLKHDDSSLFYYHCVDPFTSGRFRGEVLIGYDWDKQQVYRTFKGDLYCYYTDGESFYILVSAGPDRRYEEVPEGDVREMDKIPRYDPTNGIRSRGDIIIVEEDPRYKDWYMVEPDDRISNVDIFTLQRRMDSKSHTSDNTAFFTMISDQYEIAWKTILSTYTRVTAITLDERKNLYITGYYKFWSGKPTIFGGSDILVSKIDPEGNPVWSRALGGFKADRPFGMESDKNGNVYITGYTYSRKFPVENTPYPHFRNGDGFILKMDTRVGKLVSSSILGGTNWVEGGSDIALDSKGNIIVCGWTSSSDFPVQNALQNKYHGGGMDGFVAKFNQYGEIIWSTYLGGSGTEDVLAVCVDSGDNVFVTGYTTSKDFPVKKAQDSSHGGSDFFDGFVTAIDSNGKLLWSTFLGGELGDSGLDIASDSKGNVIVSGWTSSKKFPTKKAFQKFKNNEVDAFVAKYNNHGKMLWSTYLGGDEREEACAVKVNSKDEIIVTGTTDSVDSWNEKKIFPVKGFHSHNHASNYSVFLTCFLPEGEFAWSFIMGENTTRAEDIFIDDEDSIYLAGKYQAGYHDEDNYTSPSLGEAFVMKIAKIH